MRAAASILIALPAGACSAAPAASPPPADAPEQTRFAGIDGGTARGVSALPLTLFIDVHGEVTGYSGPALTEDALGRLVTQRLVMSGP